MSLFHLALLAIIQGVTEFLPISSSGHLILFPNLTGAEDQGLVIDVAVHVGSLFAVVIYFWRDVKLAFFGLGDLARGKTNSRGGFLALCLIIATIPVVLAGLAIKLSGLDAAMRSTAVIGWTMFGFGLVLYWADQTGGDTRKAEDWTLKDALIMGLWQVLALIPGTSRSGITITGARRLGYSREDGARLSMLMSIPTITMAGLLLGLDLIGSNAMEAAQDAVIAAVLAFLSALAALSLMFRLMKSVSFTPYVIYRVIFGIILLVLAYGYGW